MKKILTIIFLAFVLVQCTSTKWTVVETEAVDEREEPDNIGSTYILTLEQLPEPENPFFEPEIREVRNLEFNQRVLIERQVQQYRPKWGFTILSSLGAAITFYAGNTDAFINNPSQTQRIALNAAGVALTALAVMNMRPAGDPIETGEKRFLRRSGSEIRTDTVAVESRVRFSAEIRIEFENRILFEESFQQATSSDLRVNLASLFSDMEITGNDPGIVQIFADIDELEETYSYEIELANFLEPVVYITNPVAELRDSPTFNSRAILTEAGSGSELMLINSESDRWFEVRFGGSNVFVDKDAGEIRWRATDNGSSPTVVAVQDVPFGEIGVENSVPVLREAKPSDAGLIISNHSGNQIGQRRYLERDYRLLRLYYRNAFGLANEQIYNFDITDSQSWSNHSETFGADNSATLFVYIGGYAKVKRDDETSMAYLIHRDDQEIEQEISLLSIVEDIAESGSGRIVIFADLEFSHAYNSGPTGQNSNNGSGIWMEIANRMTSLQPNSAIIFSSSPNQSSGVYSSERFENMYHHIFPYYLAQGLQHRRTNLNSLIRYLENQVDYTSRRLHDRPQEVSAFGNLTINLGN